MPAVAVEDLFDFDKLLEQMGEPPLPAPTPQSTEVASVPESIPVPISILAGVHPDETDGFADMERGLREIEEQRARDEEAARRQVLQRRRQAVMSGLESWLAAIVADRQSRA